MIKKNHIYVQAREGSTRLPQKVLKLICNKSIFEHVIDRAKKISPIDNIFLLTGSYEKNKNLINLSKSLGIDYFCGSDENVLDRFYQASKKFESTNILRFTSDNPLIDPKIVNQALKIFLQNNFDILSPNRKPTLPKGLNFEIFKSKALEQSWNDMLKNHKNYEEFYQTFYPPVKNMLEKTNLKIFDYCLDENFSNLRLTVDYKEDFDLVTTIYEKLYKNDQYFDLSKILVFIQENPSILQINQKYNE